MKDITFEYASNLEENDQKWNEAIERVRESVMYFTKNTFLQFAASELQMEIMDLHIAILKGERGDYLYDKYKQLIEAFEKVKEDYENSNAKSSLQSLSKQITTKLLKDGKGA